MITMFANPERFMRVSGPIAAVCAALGAAALAYGLYLGLAVAPPEADQGETVRILYIHVPSAWLSLFLYTAMAGASLVYFIWRHTLADVAAKTVAPIGAAFAFITLATGSIWGRPTWGAWWEWDGRMASMLVLFLLFIGYMALRAALDDDRQAARAGAILAMVGVVNVPVVKFSVDWWSTLHQPAAVFRFDGPTLDAAFLQPLMIAALGFFAGATALWLARMRTEVFKRRALARRRAREAIA